MKMMSNCAVETSTFCFFVNKKYNFLLYCNYSAQSETFESTDAVLATIVKVFERFDNTVKEAYLKPQVTFIIFFMHELAKAPNTVYRQRLINIIPINLVSFALSNI